LRWYRVGNFVNSTKNEGDECIKPLEEIKQELKSKGIASFFKKEKKEDQSDVSLKKKDEQKTAIKVEISPLKKEKRHGPSTDNNEQSSKKAKSESPGILKYFAKGK
jgi:hypothetical protein